MPTLAHDSTGAVALAALSPRQREVVALMAAGLANEQISSELGLSHRTVRNYISHIYDLLDLEGRVQVVLWFQAAGAAADRSEPVS